jgi:hypothetical protein
MTDVLIYWRDYAYNMKEDRVHGWYSNARLFNTLEPGDRLWLVTSGKNLREPAEQAGFLVAIWAVKEVTENSGEDEAYPSEEYRYRVVADDEESIMFSEPVLVDHILRPPGRDKTVSIGRFLKGPRKLKQSTLRLLRAAAGPDLAIRWLTGSKT